jgi:dipeptidyl aminopeptidase/acylaminoacyl peptidase
LHPTQTPRGRWGYLAFSPDGRKLALARGQAEVPYAKPLVLDVPGGEEIFRLESSPAPGDPAASEEYVSFSPDGKTLATVGNHQDSVIRLWDAATGELIGRCGGEANCRSWSCLSFSPDGRLLATAPFDRDDAVHLWEVATLQEVARLRGHRGGVTALAFSPDGRSLASGGGDATVLVWDLTGRTGSGKHGTERLSPARLEEYWEDLRGEDAAAAYRAVRALADDPVRSVPFLAKRVRPVERVASSPEWLRQRRAVMALEYGATPEAQRLLQTLAAAEVTTPLAREARAALDRLNSHPESANGGPD